VLCDFQCTDVFAQAIDHHHPAIRHLLGIAGVNAITKPMCLSGEEQQLRFLGRMQVSAARNTGAGNILSPLFG
jgi:hypothetical protein